ncbi:MAG: hypothetical protein KA740_06015 [Rhodoferax sp.]|nr:hypothetical protein [Rhodoferax sp.]
MSKSHHLNIPSSSEPASPPWMDSQPGSANPAQKAVTVFFEAEKCSLNDCEVDKLSKWVRQWYAMNSRSKLCVGGAAVTSRSNRLRRLGFLMSLLRKLGVPQKRVRADSEWLRPAPMGAIDDLPADAIWLQVR